jgi:sterol desaturase/sphingolipid hydroxylase (fatty acid hydroxylase superfamily)
VDHEITIRVSFFFGIFLLLSLGELGKPRRALVTAKKGRWFNNLIIMVMNTLLVRFLFPLVPVTMALLARERGWGLLNQVELPYLLHVAGAVLVLDFVVYLQHVLFHAVPTLWRFHIMHHVDLDLDVTSGMRFHPVEIALSMGIKLVAIGLLGPPGLAVLIFEIVLNGTSMFNHSNIFIPLFLDRFLRLFIVTPDMHRVHHSVILKETDSNYGFALPWWDWLFGTYRAQPAKGHQGMTIGNSRFLDEKRQKLWWLLLLLPFSKKAQK